MARFKKTLLVMSIGLGFTLVAYADCNQLFNNCVQTAANNYANGTYTQGQYEAFIYDYCPDAFERCHYQ